MKEVSKSWKDMLLDTIDDAIGSVLLSPFAPILKMCGLGGAVKSVGEFGRGFVTGIAKGLASTFEGLYNMVVHPLDTLGGMATMAGVAVVGYANTIPGVSAEQRLQAFDDFFGTNLAAENDGIKQALSETGDKFLHGTNAERGEVAGQAVEFVAEVIFGTKGAGAAIKSVKAGSMGSKAAKVANAADKAADIAKVADGKVKQWTLEKLPKGTKGIFGKKPKKKISYDELKKGVEPCFLSGTLISTQSGLKSIELIDKKDRVISFDFEICNFAPKNVLNKFKNWAETYFIVDTDLGDSIKVTGRHMFWIENEHKWKIVKMLNIGDMLKTQNGITLVTNIVRVDNINMDTFNLEIQDCHNYLVGMNGILVHNQSRTSKFESTATQEIKIYEVYDQGPPEKVKYVGQTNKPTVEDRFEEHKSEGRKKAGSHKKNWDNYKVREVKRGQWTPYEASTWEQYYIEKNGGVSNLENKRNEITEKKYDKYADKHNPCK
jgi:hypothetical protein